MCLEDQSRSLSWRGIRLPDRSNAPVVGRHQTAGQERLFAATIGTTGFHRTGRPSKTGGDLDCWTSCPLSGQMNGAPGRTRTSCLRFRKPPLCPDELREQRPRKTPGLARAHCGTAASAHYAHGVRTDGLLRDPDVVVYGEEFCEAPSRWELSGASFGRPWLCTPIRFPFAV